MTRRPTPLTRLFQALALLAAGLLILAGGLTPQASYAQAVPTATATPQPTKTPEQLCVEDNGVWQNGNTCIKLSPLSFDPTVPIGSCVIVGGPTGKVECTLGLTGTNALTGAAFVPPSGGVWTLGATPGCLSVARTPYPRLLVGLGAPHVALSGRDQNGDELDTVSAYNEYLLSGGSLIARGAAGWYDAAIEPAEYAGVNSSNSLVVAGNWWGVAFGSGQDVAPNTVGLDTPLFLPSINNVQARLLFVQRGNIEVGLAGTTAFGVLTPGEDLRLTVTRSSNPNAGPYGGNVVAAGGPQINSTLNPLPAYRMQVRSGWEVVLQIRYQLWEISNGVYQFERNVGPVYAGVAGAGTRVSYRAWDPQQGTLTGLVGSPNCNATSSGYIPVPVMEGQTVLIR